MDAETYFDLFGLSADFALDLPQLDLVYHELQRSAHPDRYASSSAQERRLSMQLAARINDAYQVLKDPLQRAQYLVELGGVSLRGEHKTTSDTEFLMQQIELREDLSEVREQSDPAGALCELGKRMDESNKEYIATLTDLFGIGDEDSIAAAAEVVLKMKFYRKLREEITELEIELEDEL